MKKFTLAFIGLFAMMSISFAQTTLPTSWDCQPSTLPTLGWTTDMVNYYNAGSVGYYHSSPSACKFDATGRYIIVNFADAPGIVSYWLRGSSFSGGTFTVEESTNGTTYTAVKTYTSANLSLNSMARDSVTLNAASRYVKFVYTLKSAGNVSVDDITINKKAAGPQADIEIKQILTSIPNGGTYIFGNSSSKTFKVINHGTVDALTISGNSFTGTDASMFSIPSMPATITHGDSATFNINFAPTGADGSKYATLSITNSDVNKNPYVINLYAVKGSYATEPTAAATNLNITGVKTFKYNVAFSDATPAPENYIVLRNIGSAVTDQPTNGQTYTKGQYIGTSQVVYIGAAGSFTPTYIIANSAYHFKVFSFNGPSGFESYLTSSTLSGSVTTPHDMIGSYYSSINPLSTTLFADLHTLINPHTAMNYSSYANDMINKFECRDTAIGTSNKKVVTCVYTGMNYVYDEPFSWTDMNREHTFCQSWMPTVNLGDFQTRPEYSEYHNLFPVSGPHANSYRSNLPLGNVVTITNQYMSGKYGLDAAGHQVYEPRDSHKGDAARAMFYMVVCYYGVDGYPWTLPTYLSTIYPYGQDEAVLKAWHILDPPDAWEMARNDYIQSMQLNRNPFVDSIGWVEHLIFTNPNAVENYTESNNQIVTYPNPAKENFFASFKLTKEQDVTVAIYDITGKEEYSTVINCKSGINTIELNPALSGGLHMLRIKTTDGVFSKKIIIE